MQDEAVPFVFGFMAGGALIGLLVVAMTSIQLDNLLEANKRQWDEAVSRGYAERVQTESGDSAFRWKDK